MENKKYVIGADIGGTTVKLGLFEEDGTLLEKWEIPTVIEGDGTAVLRDIAAEIQKCREKHNIPADGILGVGAGIPGPVTADGVVHRCVNLGWGVFDVRTALEETVGLPVVVVNDANAAAMGEAWKGGGRGSENVVFITLGTGVGAGIVIGGELYCGHDTGAGEIGSIPYLDRDYEYYCSSRFFVGRGTTGKEAYERAAAGDPEALSLWREFGGHVGQLVMLVLYTYDPEAIVFGGSIAHAFGFFREAMYEQLKRFPYAKTVEGLHICCSNIDHVGLLGASACE